MRPHIVFLIFKLAIELLLEIERLCSEFQAAHLLTFLETLLTAKKLTPIEAEEVATKTKEMLAFVALIHLGSLRRCSTPVMVRSVSSFVRASARYLKRLVMR